MGDKKKKRNILHTRTKSAPILELNNREALTFSNEVNIMYCDSLFEDDDEEEDEPFDQFMDMKRERKRYYHSNLEVITSDDLHEERMRVEDSSSWEVSCSEDEEKEEEEDEEESDEI